MKQGKTQEAVVDLEVCSQVHLGVEIPTETVLFKTDQEDPSTAVLAVHPVDHFRDPRGRATPLETWGWGVLRDPSTQWEDEEEPVRGEETTATVPTRGDVFNFPRLDNFSSPFFFLLESSLNNFQSISHFVDSLVKVCNQFRFRNTFECL